MISEVLEMLISTAVGVAFGFSLGYIFSRIHKYLKEQKELEE